MAAKNPVRQARDQVIDQIPLAPGVAEARPSGLLSIQTGPERRGRGSTGSQPRPWPRRVALARGK